MIFSIFSLFIGISTGMACKRTVEFWLSLDYKDSAIAWMIIFAILIAIQIAVLIPIAMDII